MQFFLFFILLAPLTGSLLNGIALRPKNPKVAGALASCASGLSFIAALALSLTYLKDQLPIRASFDWISLGPLNLSWDLNFDALTLVMSLVVTGIGTLIHIYSIGYMDEEKGPSRYFAYLNLFLFSMLLLILGGNLPVLFVGWEGVGFCSYVLIGYWYRDIKKADAGMKAFVINRIGDAAFLIGMFICFTQMGTLRFSEMAQIIGSSNSLDLFWLKAAALFLFIGAMGKSAQIPLFTWLPDAMAGPTPVSALIHAATMVTAGIYLVSRMSFLYQLAPEVSHFIAFIGALTAIFAASIATAQRDIKKVLAYSTVSQLGFMFVALGVGAYTAAIFHLLTHAFFKALLFLIAGTIIHGLGGEQDLCKMGGLRKHFPTTFLTATVAVAAICGLPPLSGFFSKDTIVFASLSSPLGSVKLWVVMSLASLLTAFYMSRFYFLAFFGDYRGSAHPHEGSRVMLIPLILLAIGSAVTGFLGVPHGLHFLPNYLDKLLVPTVPAWTETHVFLSEIGGMFVAVAIAVLGIAIAYRFYFPNPQKSEAMAKRLGPVALLLANKYWIDELYDFVFVKPFQIVSRFFARAVDKTGFDAAILLPAKLSGYASSALSLLQSGYAQFYLWLMVAGGLFILWYSLKGLAV